MSSHATKLSLVFLISGAAALVFETLWFHQAALVFGNSVWASALVPASFMAGLGLGNAVVAFHGARVRNPVRAYAVLEVLVALTGLTLVLLLPALSAALPPLLTPLLGRPVLLNGIRLLLSFCILLFPTTAMGMSLPLLVRHLHAHVPGFGRALGRLYGWNTIGAMTGVLLSGLCLVKWVGVRGTGVVAASLALVAALLAWRLASPATVPAQPAGRDNVRPRGPSASRFLVAGLIGGVNLLGLEVLWFRLLLVFFPAVHANFAWMLAIVLGGIGIGGVMGGAWCSACRDADRFVPHVMLGNGLLLGVAYGTFLRVGPEAGLIALGLLLMAPVSIGSGVVFTLLGKAVFDRLGEATRAAGLLTFYNTVGGAVGALITGLFLLAWLNLERCFFLFAALYGLAALLALRGGSRWNRVLLGMAALGFASGLAVFPFGAMQQHLLVHFQHRLLQSRNMVRVAYREGVTATIQYFEARLLGQPVSHRLVTNNHAMSGTMVQSRRYMKLFAILPAALHPDPRSALLIGYGCGSTARALTDEPAWRHIDIVDISRDVIELSNVVFPDPATNPIHDPRVAVHLEDGRFFLQTAPASYDLITAEPPPPNYAGISGLYSREYFQLLHDRLNPGGFVTYWLPTRQMNLPDVKSVLRGFLDVFPNAGVWTASGYTWMIMGWKENPGIGNAGRFEGPWRNPGLLPELKALGLTDPDVLGSLFVADGEPLRAWIGAVRALTDNEPHLLSPPAAITPAANLPEYMRFMNPDDGWDRFAASRHLDEVWPPGRKPAARPWFEVRPVVDTMITARRLHAIPFPMIHACLTNPRLEGTILKTLNTNWDEVNILRRVLPRDVLDGTIPHDTDDPFLAMKLAAHFLAPDRGRGSAPHHTRGYAEAEACLAGIAPDSRESALYLAKYRMYLLDQSGRHDDAAAVRAACLEEVPDGEEALRRFQNWLDALPATSGTTTRGQDLPEPGLVNRGRPGTRLSKLRPPGTARTDASITIVAAE